MTPLLAVRMQRFIVPIAVRHMLQQLKEQIQIVMHIARLFVNGIGLCMKAFLHELWGRAVDALPILLLLYKRGKYSGNPYVDAVNNTAAYAGYIVAEGGARRTIKGISCCPGAGTNGQLGAFVEGGVTAGVSAVVKASAYAYNITDCYVSTNTYFADDTGLFEYTNNCNYEE